MLGLLASCSPPVEEKSQQPGAKIDSEVDLSKITAIKEEVSIAGFLVALGLCEAGDDSASVLELIVYLDTEGSVNHYELQGGGGVTFTTRIYLGDRGMAAAVYSEEILTDVVTSFQFTCDEREYSFGLEEGHYVDRL